MIELDPQSPPRAHTEIVARSPAMRELTRQLHRAAEMDANVLLTGPTGAGKSTIARLLHELGPRADGPFVAIPCAALPPERIEAALFGDHGSPARGGTLLLDDVESFPLALQSRLVRLLENRVLFRSGGVNRLDVRIVATTSADLARRVRHGRFREELYFRLRVLTLAVPPLSERRDDLPGITTRLLARLGDRFRLTDAAARRLASHDWPGNLRELENVLQRASAFSRSGLIDAPDLEFGASVRGEPARPRLAGYTMEQIERWALLDTLEHVGGNKAAAARSLGVCEKTIYNKLKRLRLRNRQIR